MQQHNQIRIFWVVALSLSMMGSFCLILKVWQKWNTTPVVVTIAEPSPKIWRVPFPAVSICPEYKTHEGLLNYTEVYYRHRHNLRSRRRNGLKATKTKNLANLTEDVKRKELDRLEAVSLLSHSFLIPGAEAMRGEMMHFLEKVAPQFSDVLLACRWQGKMVDCSHYFRPVWSYQGFCFTFNMFDNREIFTESAVQYGELNTNRSYGGWSLEKGYPPDEPLETFPVRALSTGMGDGLIIILKTNESEGDSCDFGIFRGFQILLHDPTEYPGFGHRNFQAPLHRETQAVLKPSMMSALPEVRYSAPHSRGCYFPKERQLRFFQDYTQKNCELECITNFTLEDCGCVRFFMPRDNNTLVCGPGKRECWTKARESFAVHEIKEDLQSHAKGQMPGTRRSKCDCLASCIYLKYDTDSTEHQFNWRSTFRAHRTSEHELGDGIVLSRISIYYKDTNVFTSYRRELHDRVDFLAQCGGTLGLFSGFSFISFLEILYFLTIRLWCRLYSISKRLEPGATSQSPRSLQNPGKDNAVYALTIKEMKRITKRNTVKNT